jgi:prolyl-tRNA editing enzyme YbaK/EbsC (Cys-tRNA(Pro) deacylase)
MSSDPVVRALDTLGVPYEILPIDPAFADTELFCRTYGVPAERSANTIIVASKTTPKQFSACLVLSDSRLDVNRKVRQLMGVSRASFATAADMQQLTGMEIGGVTPFSLPASVPLYVDARILDLDWVIVGGGGRTRKVRISPEVFTKMGACVVRELGLLIPASDS